MTAVELYAELRARSVKLWAQDELIYYQAPSGILTSELRTDMRRQKLELMRVLKNGSIVDLIERLDLVPV